MTNPYVPQSIYLADRQMFIDRLDAIDARLDQISSALTAKDAVAADGVRRSRARRATASLMVALVGVAVAVATYFGHPF